MYAVPARGKTGLGWVRCGAWLGLHVAGEDDVSKATVFQRFRRLIEEHNLARLELSYKTDATP
jgi:hypothetical protein